MTYDPRRIQRGDRTPNKRLAHSSVERRDYAQQGLALHAGFQAGIRRCSLDNQTGGESQV